VAPECVYLQRDGWRVGQWANDNALAYFGYTREFPIVLWHLIFDMRILYDKWVEAKDAGLFIGKWNNNDFFFDKVTIPDV